MTPPAIPTVHATALLIGAVGILIRGPSGSGKSALALDLVSRAGMRGEFAAWIADDQVVLEALNGRLIARRPPAIAGLAELRGLGIVAVDHEPAAVIRLVVDLIDPSDLERMPQPDSLKTEICKVSVVRQPVPVRNNLIASSLVEHAVWGVVHGALR
jgi:HPr kinase/phosphorylase